MTSEQVDALTEAQLTRFKNKAFDMKVYLWTEDPKATPLFRGIDAYYKKGTATPVIEGLSLEVEMVETSEPKVSVSTDGGSTYKPVALDEATSVESGESVKLKVEMEKGQTLDGIAYSWA